MVRLSLSTLLAGYVIATLVPAVTIYVLLANLMEDRLEEIREDVVRQQGSAGAEGQPTQPHASQADILEAPIGSKPRSHRASEPDPPATQPEGRQPIKSPTEAW